ncbi:oxidoreductase [Planctomycetota bacterium]|nr:oxidoreductase [Planctomycetota bacterium]
MTISPPLRFGIIGLGNMGAAHADSLLARKIPRAELAAVCDVEAERMNRFAGGQVKAFSTAEALIKSRTCNAVLIATAHYEHTTLGIAALAAGLHVMVEKPISVHKADAERLIAAYEARPDKDQVFAAMFNQRTDPKYVKLKQLIDTGELGEIRRISWIITDWFRSEAYYASGGWRATWKGEGGGVLINQCPHQLDLMQWLFGLPVRVRAHVALGKWHQIEVEDQVTAYLEYANGASGVFITTTGEAPGTNRLEVAAERGRVVIEEGKIRWTRNTVPMSEYSRTTSERFGRPDTWQVEIPTNGNGGQHVEILQNFTNAVLDGKPLIAPAGEGIRSVELGNAMLLSGLTDKTVDLPLDGKAYEKLLKKLIADSKAEKKTGKTVSSDDFSKSHTR